MSQDMEGKALSRWKTGPYRIVGATITPDGKKLVAVGQAEIALPADIANGIDGDTSALIRTERRLQIYDLVKRCEESYAQYQHRWKVCSPNFAQQLHFSAKRDDVCNRIRRLQVRACEPSS